MGTLEGLTRDVIANKKVEVDDEDTVAKYVLEQPHDEMKHFIPKRGPIGGKRRTSRKYRNNNIKKIKRKREKDTFFRPLETFFSCLFSFSCLIFFSSLFFFFFLLS